MSQEEKLMVLQLVSDGKVTPEQGVELLKAIGEERPAPQKPAPGPLTDFSQSVQRGVENAGRTAEDAARRAVERAEVLSERIAREAGDFTDKAVDKGEDFGKLIGESGENLGKVLGESGENFGKMIAHMFSRGDGPEFEFHEMRTGEFPADGEINVNLSTTNGRIVVDTWDGEGFRLDIRKTVRSGNEREAQEMSRNGFEFSHDGLNVTARSSRNEGSWGFFNSLSVAFFLTLPRDRMATLRLNSSNGRIVVGGVKGTRLTASTSNGRVEAEDCRFQATEVASANGRIELSGIPGNLVANTANGRIMAKLGGTGEWKLSSANGRIEVEVDTAPDIDYSVEASTVMGKLTVEGMENAEVLLDETRTRGGGSRRYHARTRGYSDAEKKASLQASTTMGRIVVNF